MHIRSFSNSDPPALSAIWNRLPALRGRATQVTPQTFENLVFSKPYFDPAGLLVLDSGQGVCGFAHAGFGPDEEEARISTELGVTCMVAVDPEVPREWSSRLLDASESYLRDRGAKVLYGGQIAPLTPFYLGMYGGSELPGVLAGDRGMCDLLQSAGYRPIDRVVVMQLELPARPVVDRKQMLAKRRYRVEPVEQVRALTWWEVCTEPIHEEVHFQVFSCQGGPPLGCISCWVMEPIMNSWRSTTVGLTQMWVETSARRQGLATLLVAETLRQLSESGIQRVEVQVMSQNEPAIALYQKFGFREIDQGIVFRKESPP